MAGGGNSYIYVGKSRLRRKIRKQRQERKYVQQVKKQNKKQQEESQKETQKEKQKLIQTEEDHIEIDFSDGSSLEDLDISLGSSTETLAYTTVEKDFEYLSLTDSRQDLFVDDGDMLDAEKTLLPLIVPIKGGESLTDVDIDSDSDSGVDCLEDLEQIEATTSDGDTDEDIIFMLKPPLMRINKLQRPSMTKVRRKVADMACCTIM